MEKDGSGNVASSSNDSPKSNSFLSNSIGKVSNLFRTEFSINQNNKNAMVVSNKIAESSFLLKSKRKPIISNDDVNLSEIVEIIKDMDSKSLLLNNLTTEDRCEMITRYGKENNSANKNIKHRNDVFRNSNSCPSFSANSVSLYDRGITENQHRIRLCRSEGPTIYSSRQSSNYSIIRIQNRASIVNPIKIRPSSQIEELLETSLSWDFDIFKLEEITGQRPLYYLGLDMIRKFDVCATFNVDEDIFKKWLVTIENSYHQENSYHNSTHAADVMQATGAFITQLANKYLVMDRMDEAIALIVAATHDIDHPGRSSAFLCNSRSPLAILYNDSTVLESHHAATLFKLTLGDDKINIFKNLDKESYKLARAVIIDMILATEMTRHFEHMTEFVSVFGGDIDARNVALEDKAQVLIKRMLIKVADVSNPSRPQSYCIEWALRIAEEYFTQTDEEKSKGLPVVMPTFDRATCSIPKSQIDFIEYIIQDMMHAWNSFIDMPELITYMQYNYSQWKKFEEEGILTLAGIKTKLTTLTQKKSASK